MPHTGSNGLPQQLRDRIQDVIDKLRQRRIPSGIEAAKGTADLMRSLVTSSRLADPQSLLDEVKSVGIQLQLANPSGEDSTLARSFTSSSLKRPNPP